MVEGIYFLNTNIFMVQNMFFKYQVLIIGSTMYAILEMIFKYYFFVVESTRFAHQSFVIDIKFIWNINVSNVINW